MKTVSVSEGEIKTIIKENLSDEIEILCKKNSKLIYYNIDTEDIEKENSISKEAIITIILDDYSDVDVKNILLSEKRSQKLNIKIIHNGRNSKSRLENKTILTNSTVEINGLIRINDGAEESVGYQRSDFLILKDSKAISLPDLEIKNNNVKCTHSSSITRLDNEKLFYLQSRGLDLRSAKELIIEAFIEEAIKNIGEKDKERINLLLKNKLARMEK